jgi:hypothetical protein
VSGAAGLDVRVPIGGLFTALGLVIGVYGIVTSGDAARYAPSAGLNVNLWWGVVMLAFGVLLLTLASRARRTAGALPAETTPEGRATERREHVTGLER